MRYLVTCCLTLLTLVCVRPAFAVEDPAWICPPCGCPGDTLSQAGPGECPHCGMELVQAGSQRKVAVLVFDGVEILDFAGPMETLVADHGQFDVFTVAKAHGSITAGGCLEVVPQFDLSDCPEVDILVVPGGGVGEVSRDTAVLRFVRERAERAEMVLSVCSGAFILAEAGLLRGLKVTAHEGDVAQLGRQYPDLEVVHARFVDNGKIITAGGVSSGIDGALHIIDRVHGSDAARRVADYLQHRMQPGMTVTH